MGTAFCPICYEVADIFTQNLESVSGCGHVFHESCLQRWVNHSPVKPQCPLCKVSCGSSERHRLYFQSSTDGSLPADAVADVSHDKKYTEYVRILEEKLTLLKKSLELSRRQTLELQSAAESNTAKVHNFSESARLANLKRAQAEEKLKKSEQDLELIQKEKARLVEDIVKLERNIASTKLAENVDINEHEVLNLTLAGVSRTKDKDEYIHILARTLVTRNSAYKNLMTICNEYCVQKNRAENESSKLRAKVDFLQRRLKEIMNTQEQKENLDLRSIRNTQFGRESSLVNTLDVHDSDVGVIPGMKTSDFFPLSATRTEVIHPGSEVETVVDDQIDIPVRRERKSSFSSESHVSDDLLSWQRTALTLSSSAKVSGFHFGPDGPTCRAVVKPPPPFILPAPPKGTSSGRQSKRLKATPQDVKINQFFGPIESGS